MAQQRSVGVALLVIFAAVAALLTLFFIPFVAGGGGAVEADSLTAPLPRRGGPLTVADFVAPRPEDAPAGLHDAVALGARIVADTGGSVPELVGNGLACSSCHFDGGRTAGGRNGGISLVGAAASYPRPSPDTGAVEDLAGRVNRCFEENLAGRPLPAGSEEETAVLSYLHWLSDGVPTYADVEWLGLAPLPPSGATGDGEHAGRALFAGRCAVCHGADGGGTEIAPPVWGRRSFAAGSDLAQPPLLAAFVHANMPREDPALSVDEAWQVAGFVTSRPRPGAE